MMFIRGILAVKSTAGKRLIIYHGKRLYQRETLGYRDPLLYFLPISLFFASLSHAAKSWEI